MSSMIFITKWSDTNQESQMIEKWKLYLLKGCNHLASNKNQKCKKEPEGIDEA